MGESSPQWIRIGAVALGALLGLGCVPLPVQPLPAVSGRLVDAESGDPVAGAIVVVRFDVRRGELLPERDLIGHREAVSDATGRFRVARGAVPGVGSWPRYGLEARVVGAMTPTHRCARPHKVPARGTLVMELEPARSDDERRESCRPLAARPDEAPGYLAAWRELYPRSVALGDADAKRQVERLLEARALFGPGENCSGPAVDLALSPGGTHVAIAEEAGRGRQIEVIELGVRPKRLANLAAEEPSPSPALRLAWASDAALVLWDPALAGGGALPRELWTDPTAAAATRRPRPIDLADLNDEGDARWQGRSFRVERRLDPATGLASERMRVTHPGGHRRDLALPGEACGPRGQYGRPHFRISGDGRQGLDLRWIEGGCRAVSVDLESGRWRVLSSSRAGGECREARTIPMPQLRRAIRGYTEEIEDTLQAGGADPRGGFELEIASDGTTRLLAKDYLGKALRVPLSAFPMSTPLRRVQVGTVGSPEPAPVASPEPGALPASIEPL